MTSEKNPEKSPADIPIALVIEWLNERNQILEKEKADLRAFLMRNPEGELDPTVKGKLADMGGQNTVLKDFTGFIVGKSAELKGLLDDPSTIIGEKPLEDPGQNIDKA
jgi:hypothetical protein